MHTRQIDAQLIEFEPLTAVRDSLKLPESFGIRTFLDYPIPPQRFWGESAVLQHIQDKLQASVPSVIDTVQLPELADQLAAIMRAEFVTLADKYELPLEDIDAASEDFRDLLLPGVYDLIQKNLSGSAEPFDMETVIERFFNDTAYFDVQTATYPLASGRELLIKLIYDHFGPFALSVQAEDEVHYTLDTSLYSPSTRPLTQMAIDLGTLISERLLPNKTAG